MARLFFLKSLRNNKTFQGFKKKTYNKENIHCHPKMTSHSKFETNTNTINPNWQQALDKVMHTSLMTKSGNDPLGTSLQYGTQDADSVDNDSLGSEDDLDDENIDDESLSSDDAESRAPPPRPPPPPPSRLRPTPPPPPPPPPPRPSPMPARPSSGAFPAPTTKMDATKKRMEENTQLQKEEKFELLGRLQYFADEKGFKPLRILGPEDDLEDIRYEVFRAQREMTKKRNVKMMQKGLVSVGAGIEFMNAWYNPLKLRLDGFSKSLLLSIREYDEIFEELHWKYCDAVTMPPELKLVMTFTSSIFFFHMSNTANVPAAPAPSPSPEPFVATEPPKDGAPGPLFTSTNQRNDIPGTPAPAAPQRRLNRPGTIQQSSAGPMDGGGMDMGTLMSGLGMVQQLMSTSNV